MLDGESLNLALTHGANLTIDNNVLFWHYLLFAPAPRL